MKVTLLMISRYQTIIWALLSIMLAKYNYLKKIILKKKRLKLIQCFQDKIGLTGVTLKEKSKDGSPFGKCELRDRKITPLIISSISCCTRSPVFTSFARLRKSSTRRSEGNSNRSEASLRVKLHFSVR